MKQKIKVSIVLPVYNAEKYINKTINSLLNQTLKDIEIICVNDGSKDSTLKIIEKLKEQDDRIRIIDKNNEGVWKARIDGIKQATGNYIAFIDSDDYVEKDFIERLYDNITKNNSDISICGFKRIDEKSGKVLSKEMKYEENKKIEKNYNFEEVITVNTALWNKLYKASILKELKELKNPPRILEDMMFLAKVYLQTEKITFVDDYLYNYIVREGSAMNTLKQGEIDIIQNAMLEIKQEYLKSEDGKKNIEILSSMAFLHFGISLMLRISNDANCNFKKEYKDNLKYLNNNFPEWKKTKYLKIIYCLKNKSSNIKLAIVKKLYVFHMFGIFISTYKFITNKLKIDIKW